MADTPVWYLLAVGLLVVYSAASALRTFHHTRRQRHLTREITERGETTIGRVVGVDPVRTEPGAVGHPVTVAFTDPTGVERQFRDESGLNGYTVRVGGTVTVRYHPDDPGSARVEEIVGRFGPFPVHPAGGPSGPSYLRAIVSLAGAMVVLPASYLIDFDRINPLLLIFPLFLLLGPTLAVAFAVSQWRDRRERGGPMRETVGVVTSVWHEYRDRTRMYPFTVHFTTHDGREIHTRYRTASNTFRPTAGQQVRVRYPPGRPYRYQVRELRYVDVLSAVVPYVIGVLFFVLGLIGTLFGIVLPD